MLKNEHYNSEQFNNKYQTIHELLYYFRILILSYKILLAAVLCSYCYIIKHSKDSVGCSKNLDFLFQDSYVLLVPL